MLAPRILPRRGRRPVIGRVVVTLLTGLVALLLFLVLSHAPIFSISHLAINGDPNGKVSKVISILTKNQNIFLLDENRIRTEVLKNPQVKQIYFEKTLPNSLTVNLTFRDPAFAWQGTNGTFIVDDTGFIFQSGSAAGIPSISSPDDLQIGKNINPDKISKVSSLIKNNPAPITAVSIQADRYQATFAGGTVAIFDPSGDLSAQSQALQLIIAKAKIDGKLPRTVDLRFPKPVVTY